MLQKLSRMTRNRNRLVVAALVLLLIGWEVISRLLVFATPGIDTMRTYGDYMTLIGSKNDPSYGTVVETGGEEAGYAPTGLNFGEFRYVPWNSPGYWGVGGNTASDGFNYSLFNSILMYCVDRHTGDISRKTFTQAFSRGILRLDQDGNLVNSVTGESISHAKGAKNKKFTQLMLVAALGYQSDWSSKIDKDGYLKQAYCNADSQTAITAMRAIIWSCSDEGGFSGEWADDFSEFSKNEVNLGDWNSRPVTDPFAIRMGCRNYAEQVFCMLWTTARINMNMEFNEDGSTVKKPVSSENTAAGQVRVYDFSKELVQAGLPDLLDVQVNGGTYSWDAGAGTLTVTAPNGAEVSGTATSKGPSWDGTSSVGFPNLANANIAEFWYYSINQNGMGDFTHSQAFMSVAFTDTYTFSFGGTPPPEGEVYRYDHQETWSADYNVRLAKYDSETGKPLEGAQFDILEKFDDSQLRDTDLETDSNYTTEDLPPGNLLSTAWGEDDIESNYDGELGAVESINNLRNWENDSTKQFKRWDDPYNDPCPRDREITAKDGFLRTDGSDGGGSPAHNDSRDYTYHKGFCGGHPAPVIEYQEPEEDSGEGEESEEDSEAIEEENQRLHDEAWQTWFEGVETCYELANEGS